MKVENFRGFMKSRTLSESLMDDQWQDPDHAADNGGVDEFSWADRDGNAGHFSDETEEEDDYQTKEDNLASPKTEETFSLYDIKMMISDMSSRISNFEKNNSK